MTDTILQFAISVVVVVGANYFLLKSLRKDKEYSVAPVLDAFEDKVEEYFDRQYTLKIKKRYTHNTISAKDYKKFTS